MVYIFSLIGFTNKILAEIAFGIPYGANTTNLICNWGFYGLLIEGNFDMADASRKFFNLHPDTKICPSKIINTWITTENINSIFRQNNVSGQIDVFCLDVDRVDYWLWKNLTEINPRVVVVEYLTFWGSTKAVTVPYKTGFNRFDIHPDYFGASLPAFVRLAKEKGYRLVACNQLGYNTFFVRNDIAQRLLPEIPIERCFGNFPLEIEQDLNKRLQAVQKFAWIEV